MDVSPKPFSDGQRSRTSIITFDVTSSNVTVSSHGNGYNPNCVPVKTNKCIKQECDFEIYERQYC